MTLPQRVPLLLVQPDYATSDLYDDPPVIDAFYVVTAYAVLSALNTLLSLVAATGSFSASLMAVIGTVALVYLTWVFLTLIFHFIADVLGGLGELHNAVSFVGLAAVPNALIAVLSLFLTIIRLAILPDDPDAIIGKINLGFSLLGMVWGWPGVLCYFGLKNAERVNPIKAIVVVLPVFFLFAALEIFGSTLFEF
jgi:hypothetical protein